jgi:hypothetical protein
MRNSSNTSPTKKKKIIIQTCRNVLAVFPQRKPNLLSEPLVRNDAFEKVFIISCNDWFIKCSSPESPLGLGWMELVIEGSHFFPQLFSFCSFPAYSLKSQEGQKMFSGDWLEGQINPSWIFLPEWFHLSTNGVWDTLFPMSKGDMAPVQGVWKRLTNVVGINIVDAIKCPRSVSCYNKTWGSYFTKKRGHSLEAESL